MLFEISFDINCRRPLWVLTHRDIDYARAGYRVYVNDDLIVERDWIWDNKIYLRENILVDINLNLITPHTLKIIPIPFKKNYAKFIIENLKIGNNQVRSNKMELSFKVNKYSITEIL
jgi:hypothetical protein